MQWISTFMFHWITIQVIFLQSTLYVLSHFFFAITPVLDKEYQTFLCYIHQYLPFMIQAHID